MKNFIFISLLLIISNTMTLWFSSEISLSFGQPEVAIVAEIQLETNCELMNKAFIVVDLKTDKSVGFNSSKAYLGTVTGNPLQVQLNPKYNDMTSNFEIHNAEKKMKIELDCNSSNKLNNALDSLKNTFKN